MLHVPFNDAKGIPHCLIELHPTHENYLAQIAGKDRVHAYGATNIDELREFRIGGPVSAKTAFAVVNHTTDQVGAVIFGHKTSKPIRSGADLQGDVDAILKEKASVAFNAKATAMVFYTISAFSKGSGPALINVLLQNTSGFEPATLSPVRDMRKTYPHLADAALSAEEKIVLTYLHLMDRDNDVQKFHMGNGAIIRDIKLNANAPDSEDGVNGMGMMINYGYTGDVSTLDQNRTTLSRINSGALPPESILQLTEASLAYRVMNYVSAGAMKSLHTPNLLDNMKRAMDTIMRPAAPAMI